MGDAPETAGVRRGAWVVAAVAFGVGIAVAGLTYSILAIPLYVFAQTDPNGLDRPLIRTAFFNVALPVGALAGIAAGAVVGVWYRRGGRLPDDRRAAPEDPLPSAASLRSAVAPLPTDPLARRAGRLRRGDR